MAGNTINFELKLNSNIKRETEDARAFHKEIRAAAAAAQNIEYGRARGAMGSTGASARDFANQAQGLGGLVRIYATVAANTFAAISAFNALKQAADTTALREGLNQLGAASGIALGNLAKGFVEATDGAVSFREAASAAAKATAAGLSSRQFLQIGETAKKAAQALGIDMADATNRLVRGITKLEPELLDELGIYTKLGPATEEYARKLGKTATSLTDFERRQAFAVAVLEEGNKKFKEIDIPTNPYQQLEASIRNLTQVGLELINSFLTPIANVLANSTTLLGIALGLIVLKLTKMAIPAITNWQASLVSSAETAKTKAQDINETFGERFADRIRKGFEIPKLQETLAQAEEQYKTSRNTLLTIDKDYAEKRKSFVYKTARDPKALATLKPEELKKLGGAVQREIAQQSKLSTDASKLQVIALQEYKAAILQVLAARQSLTIAEGKAKIAEEAPKTMGERLRERISRQAGARKERLIAVSQVSEDVEKDGFSEAIKKLNKRIAESRDMTGFDKFRTKVTGVFAAAATSVGMFVNAFGGIMQGVGIAILALTAFDKWASSNTKQMQEFSKEIDKNTEAVENAERVMKRYKDSFLTTDSLMAVGTALGELTDGVGALTDAFQATLDKQGVWDKIKEGILSAFSEGAQQDFSAAIAANWTKQIDMLPEGEVKAAATEKLKSALNITDISVKTIRKAIADADIAKEVVARGEQALAPAITRARQLGTQAAATRESIQNLNKASMDLQTTFTDQSPIAKFAEALIKASLDIQNSFKDINSGVAAFKELLSKPGAFALIDTKDLANYQEAVRTQEKILSLEKQRGQLRTDFQKIEEQATAALKATSGRFVTPEQIRENPQLIAAPVALRRAGRFVSQRNALTNQISNISKEIEDLTASGTKSLFDSLQQTFSDSLAKGFELLRTSVVLAQRQARLGEQRSILSGISGPGIAGVTASLAREELKIQEDQLNIMGQLVDQLSLNTIAQQQANNLLEIQNILAKGPPTREDITQLEMLRRSQGELGRLQQSVSPGGTPLTQQEVQGFLPQAGGIGLQMALNRSGREAQLAGLRGRGAVIDIDERINKLRETQQIETETANTLLKSIQFREKLRGLVSGALSDLSEQQVVENQILETQRFRREQAAQLKTLENEIADIELRIGIEKEKTKGVDNEVTRGLGTRLEFSKQLLQNTKSQQDQDLQILSIQQAQARIRAGLARESEDRQFESTVQDKIAQAIQTELESRMQVLDAVNQKNVLTADEYNIAKRNIELQMVELDTQNKLRQVEAARLAQLKQIEGERELALAAGSLREADVARLKERESRVNQIADMEISGIRRVNQVRQEGILLQTQETDRQKAYDAAFKNSFSSMADAIVSWAETGKWAGKDLFKSLTADLLRYELRLQMFQAYGGIRNTLLAPFGASAGASLGLTEAFAASFGQGLLAKGGAFDSGVKMYAKGGTFTNSIVDQPTLFKFAKGTGLMGEAGPEAIMPLKRDSSGNLGVRGTGQKTEVIVNNYSATPATTQESTDSRGNRKIEVIIGEAAAGDIGRSGSNSQRAMRGTFGLRPQLLRR